MRLKYHNEFMCRMLALFAFVNLFAASKSLALSLTFVLALGFLLLLAYRREQRDERAHG